MVGTTRRVGSKAKRENSLVSEIISGLHQRSDKKTKDWFTNYVKGTCWVGCKVPKVRQSVVAACLKLNETEDNLLDSAVDLLQHDECDIKLAGMLLLSEKIPLEQLASEATLQRLEDEILLQNHIRDWSSADWFAMKVLRRIVFSGKDSLVDRVLNYTKILDHADYDRVFVRRCGVVSFLHYERNRDKLPMDFGKRLIDACEHSLNISPEQRFTQTGIAWVLRYVILQPQENAQAMEMIVRNGALWTPEAKKSMVEKLKKNDPRRKQILQLDKN